MSKHHVLISITSLFITISGTVKAQELDAAETRALLAQGPWQMASGGGSSYYFWESDGTVCVKKWDPAAEGCDDTGTWTRKGTEVCYDLEWIGKSVGYSQGCFHVAKLEDEDYDYECIDSENGIRRARIKVLSAD